MPRCVLGSIRECASCSRAQLRRGNMVTMNAARVERCHCNSCGRRTDHTLVDRRKVEDLDEIDESSAFWWTDTYDVLQCRGCGAVCLRDTYEDAAGDKQVSYYPPPVSRRAPSWRFRLPSDMRELLDEVYTALHYNGRRLALMGVRTLVDMLMLKEIGDVGTFEKKLEGLQDQGVIAERSREVLSAALDAGNAAAHRGYKPNPEDLNAVMDIVENLLQATYHLSELSARIKKATPAKPKKMPTL